MNKLIILLLIPAALWSQNPDCSEIAFRVDTEAYYGNCAADTSLALCSEQNLLKALEGKSLGDYVLYPKSEYADKVSLQLIVAESGRSELVSAEGEVVLDENIESLVTAFEELGMWNPARKDQEKVCVLVNYQFSYKSKSEIDEGYHGEVYKVLDNMPHFYTPECETYESNRDREECSKGKMLEFLYGNLKYPRKAVDNNIQGMVVVQFIVEKDGKLNKIEVVRSLTPELDQAAIEVVSSMPAWVPGSLKGERKRVINTLPIRFKIQD